MPDSATLSSPPPSATLSAADKLRAFARDIKISHTVFALPFALLSAFLAAAGFPRLGTLGLILLCMVTARSLAMAANRLLDAELDARNPRTARRAIPGGLLSRSYFRAMAAACAAAFIAATTGFYFFYGNPWPLRLALPVLLFLCAYPLLKRFTRLCHYYLGAALGLAPVCAWIAIRGALGWPPVLMAAAVLWWTAGFDIIYACQDYQSDVECGVFAIPSAIGIGPALWVARLTHLLSVVMMLALRYSTPLLGPLYLLGVVLATALLLIEHRLVRADDLSRVGLAFFTINGIISLLLGSLGIADIVLRHH